MRLFPVGFTLNQNAERRPSPEVCAGEHVARKELKRQLMSDAYCAAQFMLAAYRDPLWLQQGSSKIRRTGEKCGISHYRGGRIPFDTWKEICNAYRHALGKPDASIVVSVAASDGPTSGSVRLHRLAAKALLGEGLKENPEDPKRRKCWQVSRTVLQELQSHLPDRGCFLEGEELQHFVVGSVVVWRNAPNPRILVIDDNNVGGLLAGALAINDGTLIERCLAWLRTKKLVEITYNNLASGPCQRLKAWLSLSTLGTMQRYIPPSLVKDVDLELYTDLRTTSFSKEWGLLQSYGTAVTALEINSIPLSFDELEQILHRCPRLKTLELNDVTRTDLGENPTRLLNLRPLARLEELTFSDCDFGTGPVFAPEAPLSLIAINACRLTFLPPLSVYPNINILLNCALPQSEYWKWASAAAAGHCVGKKDRQRQHSPFKIGAVSWEGAPTAPKLLEGLFSAHRKHASVLAALLQSSRLQGNPFANIALLRFIPEDDLPAALQKIDPVKECGKCLETLLRGVSATPSLQEGRQRLLEQATSEDYSFAVYHRVPFPEGFDHDAKVSALLEGYLQTFENGSALSGNAPLLGRISRFLETPAGQLFALKNLERIYRDPDGRIKSILLELYPLEKSAQFRSTEYIDKHGCRRADFSRELLEKQPYAVFNSVGLLIESNSEPVHFGWLGDDPSIAVRSPAAFFSTLFKHLDWKRECLVLDDISMALEVLVPAMETLGTLLMYIVETNGVVHLNEEHIHPGYLRGLHAYAKSQDVLQVHRAARTKKENEDPLPDLTVQKNVFNAIGVIYNAACEFSRLRKKNSKGEQPIDRVRKMDVDMFVKMVYGKNDHKFSH